MIRVRVPLAVMLLVLSACSGAGADETASTTAQPVVATTSTSAVPVETQAPAASESPYAVEIEDWQRTNDVVGAVVLVVDSDGEGVPFAVGHSDRQGNVAMSADDLFRLGSITKVYAAALALTLVEDGELDLEQSASDFVPNLPSDVTIEHLLSHTSGLRDVDVAAGILEAIEAGGLPDESRDAIDEALERGLVFDPGSRQSYSSIGYIAAERIIEGAVGRPWEQALADRVLSPTVQTHLEDDSTQVPTPYERLGPASPPISLASLPTSQFARGAGAAGGLVASANDVATFIRGLFAGNVVSVDSLAEMTDVTAPRDSYGLGLAFYDIGTVPVYGHNGRTIGFASSVRHDPVNNVTVVVLSNDGGAPTEDLANLLIQMAVSDR